MNQIITFTDEQSRILVNLHQQYEVWLEAERTLAILPYGMRWKVSAGREYLYEILDRAGNAKSLGLRDVGTEATYAEYEARKQSALTRRADSAVSLNETCGLYRSVRLPVISNDAAALLRELDRRSLLGSHVMVVGTNAMPAYTIEAGGWIRAPETTIDLDFAWTAASEGQCNAPFWAALKAVDGTFTVNTERTFQVRNSKAYEVELLIAPSLEKTFALLERPRPIGVAEQEWLLWGRRVDHVVVAADGSPARLVVPDPRWFALQKLWLSQQEKRHPLKREKDAAQGTALLNAIAQRMPQFRLDAAFRQELPEELGPIYDDWRRNMGLVPAPAQRWSTSVPTPPRRRR
jgi:hypothetical protein